MNTKTHYAEKRLERHLQDSATKLHQLDDEIRHAGGFVQRELQGRLHQVEVMEQALERNFREVFQARKQPTVQRVRNLKRLCRHIEREEVRLQHEVEFLSMGSASALVAMVEKSSGLMNDAYRVVCRMIPPGLRRRAQSKRS